MSLSPLKITHQLKYYSFQSFFVTLKSLIHTTGAVKFYLSATTFTLAPLVVLVTICTFGVIFRRILDKRLSMSLSWSGSQIFFWSTNHLSLGHPWHEEPEGIISRVRSNEKKNTKKVDPFQNWFFVISDHYWTGLGWFKPFFAFRGPIGAVGGQFWVLGVLKGRKFEISKLDHFWPWDATFLT